MGFPLGSFTLIQFSPLSAEGEAEEERHGRGEASGGEQQKGVGGTARQEERVREK